MAERPLPPFEAAEAAQPRRGPVVRALEAEIDGRGRIVSCNVGLARLFGVSPAALVGRTIDDFAVGASRRSIVRAAADAASGIDEIGPIDLWLAHEVAEPVACRFWVSPRDGAPARFLLRGHDLALLGPDHRLRALETILLERVATGDSLTSVLSSLAQLVEWRLVGSHCSIGVVDEDGIIRHRAAGSMPLAVTDVFDDMRPDEKLPAVGRSAHGLEVVVDPAGVDERLAPVLADLDVGALWMMRVELDDSSDLGGLIAVLVPPSTDPDGAAYNVLRSTCDIASTAISRSVAERRMLHQAAHDPLTGLPNRTLLFDRIAQSVARSRQLGELRTAVLMIDLDHFKVVNDSMSHTAGDRVLQRVAEILSSVADPAETVGRFGGDEFLVVTQVAGQHDAADRANQIRQALDVSVSVGGVAVQSSASIGVVVAGSLSDARALVRDADAALHRAKEDGRNRVVVFDRSMRESVLARVELETALRRGIAAHELEVHYQPIVDIATLDVAGVEALARWRRSTSELVLPNEFVPLAEDVGLIEDLGMDVLEQATQVAVELRRAAWPDLVMSVNVSARQLGSDLVDRIDAVLRNAGLDPDALCIEITEGVLTRAGADQVVRSIARLGVCVAIDDFGTGFASLEYLRRFPVAGVLKIDGSFVADLDGPGPAAQAIVAAASVLGHSLEMDVVAEGVETIGQLQLLRDIGCDRAQGYLLGRPVAPGELFATLGQVVSRAESG